jgi:hypothetical protein
LIAVNQKICRQRPVTEAEAFLVKKTAESLLQEIRREVEVSCTGLSANSKTGLAWI